MINKTIRYIVYVEFAIMIFTKRSKCRTGAIVHIFFRNCQPIHSKCSYNTAAVICTKIFAVHVWIFTSPIYKATGDGTITAQMLVLVHGKSIARLRFASTRIIGMISFITAPAIVLAALAAGVLKIYFFPEGLAHICNDQSACKGIKTPAPGVAQPERPNLMSVVSRINKGIRCRYCIRIALPHINAQHLSQQAHRILCIVIRITRAASVTHANV
jgi:hypothetical protein